MGPNNKFSDDNFRFTVFTHFLIFHLHCCLHNLIRTGNQSFEVEKSGLRPLYMHFLEETPVCSRKITEYIIIQCEYNYMLITDFS